MAATHFTNQVAAFEAGKNEVSGYSYDVSLAPLLLALAFFGGSAAALPGKAVKLARAQSLLAGKPGVKLLQDQPGLSFLTQLDSDQPLHSEAASLFLSQLPQGPLTAASLNQAYERSAGPIKALIASRVELAGKDLAAGDVKQVARTAELLKPFLAHGKDSPAAKLQAIAEIPGLDSLSPDAAGALAAFFFDGTAHKTGDLHPAWNKLVETVRNPKSSVAALDALGQRYFADGEAALKRRMPTLAKLLENPNELGRFLFALSQLRKAVPYDGPNVQELSPIALSEKDDRVFEFGELRVVPASESFRRHIIYVDDAEGRYAIELKMPGEFAHKWIVRDQHFDIPAELWEKFPDNPGVVKPLYFGQFDGKLMLYGKTHQKPLDLVIFEYKEGRRFTNSEALIERLSRKLGKTPEEIRLQAAADAAVAAIRLHLLGYSENERDTTDFHPENLKLLEDGRGVLVADFGDIRKVQISLRERISETLDLLGLNKRMRLAIFPEVVRQLTEGVVESAQRELLEQTAKEELNLTGERRRYSWDEKP